MRNNNNNILDESQWEIKAVVQSHNDDGFACGMDGFVCGMDGFV